MYNEVRVLTHSSIKISGEMVIYVDPFKIRDESHDAGLILVTHDHFDHYSPDDIKMVAASSTVVVVPMSLRGKLEDEGISEDRIEYVAPGDELEVNDIKIEAVPAYNVGKKFHPQENRWVGYKITMGGTSYYVAGDTDINDDVRKVRCDVALLPCGGTYTMTAEQAAELAKIIAPKLAIPTHYGSVAGDAGDGDRFANLLKGMVDTDIRMEY